VDWEPLRAVNRLSLLHNLSPGVHRTLGRELSRVLKFPLLSCLTFLLVGCLEFAPLACTFLNLQHHPVHLRLKESCAGENDASQSAVKRSRLAGPPRSKCDCVRTAACVHPHLVLCGWELGVLELDIPHDKFRTLLSVLAVDIHTELSTLANEVALLAEPPQLPSVGGHCFRLHRYSRSFGSG
jgi:hypothetical protein